MFAKNESVQDKIYQNDQPAEDILCKGSEICRVNQRKNILFNEAAAVNTAAAETAQIVFQRCQGANPAGEFSHRTPDNSGQMHKGQARPAQNKHSARNDKDDKQKMCRDNHIREKLIHASPVTLTPLENAPKLLLRA